MPTSYCYVCKCIYFLFSQEIELLANVLVLYIKNTAIFFLNIFGAQNINKTDMVI